VSSPLPPGRPAGWDRVAWLALLSSLVVHATIGGIAAVAAGSLRGPDRRRVEPAFLTPQMDLEIIEDPDPEYEPPDEAPADRVVEAPDTNEEGRPTETPRFAAAKTTFTKQESRARIRVISPDRVSAAEPSAPGDTERGELERAPTPAAGGGRTSVRLPDDPARSDPSPRAPSGGLFAIQVPSMLGSGATTSGTPRLPREPGEPGPPGPPGPPPEQLRPTLGNLRSAIMGTGLEDLEDVEEGDRTALNALEWRHAPFFNRVQMQVEQYWRPAAEYLEHDPTGHIYGYRDRVTVLKVVLNRDGSLRTTYVIEESGAAFLDDEAREAIAQAAPFPRPPRGLVDPESNVVAFRFSFTVQVNESPIIRMERMPE
jgi:TonB family protein